MAPFTLRPDFKTSGGECCDIMWKGRFVGSITLLYREHDRMTGSVQLDKDSLQQADKAKVVEFVRDYVQSLIHAVRATECDVLVTYSSYDKVIATPVQESDEDFDLDWVQDDDPVGDFDPNDYESIEMGADEDGTPVVYELVVVEEKRDRVEYHIYDDRQNWVAEAEMHLAGPDVTGQINWVFDPGEQEIEHVTDLVVSDFDENQIDTFQIDHRFQGEIIESIELTHEDLLDEEKDSVTRKSAAAEEDEYTVVLARDDGDMLTYEIYKQSLGGFPIGTATVDISRHQMSGYVDFRDRDASADTEKIAALLMRELDKEKDYDTFSLTMLYKNEPIDELLFESERVH